MNEGLTENAEWAGKIKRFIKEECGVDLNVTVREDAGGIGEIVLEPAKRPYVVLVTETLKKKYVVMAEDSSKAEDVVAKYRDFRGGECFYEEIEMSPGVHFDIDAWDEKVSVPEADDLIDSDFPDLYVYR